MFVINSDNSIYITRGDTAVIEIRATSADNSEYIFQPGDVVRLKVVEKRKCENVILEKETQVTEEAYAVVIELDKTDTKIGGVINKPVDYWYEVELNPDTNPQTIIAYDSNGPKIFRIFPEGGDGF